VDTTAPLRVLHVDEHIAVVDKPVGVLAHESRLAARELDTVLARARQALGRPAWLAHRLDRATSGCLLLGRTAR
jgi:tRNA pseudouridine65 synthase